MRRPTSAFAKVVLGTALAATTVSAQQSPSPMPPAGTDEAAAVPQALNAARSARHLLRNGWDYITYQEYERALGYFREAESRSFELNDPEKLRLKQGIERAQRGLQEASNGTSNERSYARSGPTRRPGALALARPSQTVNPPAIEREPIQLAGGGAILTSAATLTQTPAATPAQAPAANDVPAVAPEAVSSLTPVPTSTSTPPPIPPAPDAVATAEAPAPLQAVAAEPPLTLPGIPVPVPGPGPGPETAPPASTPAEVPVAEPALPDLPPPPDQISLPNLSAEPAPLPAPVAVPSPAPVAAEPVAPAPVVPEPVATSAAELPLSTPELPPELATPELPSQRIASASSSANPDAPPALPTTPAPEFDEAKLPTLPPNLSLPESPGTPAANASPTAEPAPAPAAETLPPVSLPTTAPAAEPVPAPAPAPAPEPAPAAETLPPVSLPTTAPAADPAPAPAPEPPALGQPEPGPADNAPRAEPSDAAAAAVAPTTTPVPVPVPVPAPEPVLETPPPPMSATTSRGRFGTDTLVPERTGEYKSTLSPELQRDVERIAARQEAEMQRDLNQPINPGDEPSQAPGVNGPTSTRLEIQRAPSPTEARPIRAIPVPEEFVPLPKREWEPNRKLWSAAATCHLPLYFQDASLERYGYNMEQHFGRLGRFMSIPIDDPRYSKQRNQIVQPFFSMGLFAAQIVLLPYNMIMDPPWESEYDLGYYRPGDRVPTDVFYLPLTGIGPPLKGKNYAVPANSSSGIPLPPSRW